MSKLAMTACPDCDLLVSLHHLPKHVHANCPRCGNPLYDNRPHRLDHLFALAFTGFILWFPSCLLPLMEVRLLGHELSTSIVGAGLFLMGSDYWFVGGMVVFAGAMAPFLTLSLLLWILVGFQHRWKISKLVIAMKFLGSIRQWAMLEIYLISFLVAVFKLKDYADIQLGLGFISYMGLFTIILVLAGQYNRHYMWQLIDMRKPNDKRT